MKNEIIKKLIDEFGETYSQSLNIDLESKEESEIFRWFLASLLFGMPIREEVAMNTYRSLVMNKIDTCDRILSTPPEKLIRILDMGGYARYDFVTTKKLLGVVEHLKEKYGSLGDLYEQSKDQNDLENKLQEFRGVGPTTSNIFLREMRDIWDVDPLPHKFVVEASRNLGLTKKIGRAEVLDELKKVWKENKIKGRRFSNFEAALLRLGKNYCRKNKCDLCSLNDLCWIKSKKGIRYQIWDLMEKEKISKHPKPCHGRIPNFKGSTAAAKILRNTKEWKNSKVVFSSPDSAQQKVREYALKDGKILIMASPKLKRGYLLVDPSNVKGNERSASTIKGAFRFGKSIEKFPEVDLVVEGSVAVDRFGNRLGKGGGYGDIEISCLLEEESITTETPIVTTVHEIQIVDRVPREPHDQKINMIVTPREVIRI